MTGIRIPETPRASGTFDALDRHPAPTSPFDAIRRTTAEGREWWSARELQPLLGYSIWRDFANAISRARVAAVNSGHDTTRHFAGARKVAASGPDAEDFHLSRLACYLVAMNGDPRKDEIAAAQTYFAVRTREAEVAVSAQPAVMPTHSEALRGWADAIDRADREAAARLEAESRARELAVPASAWQEMAESSGDYAVSDAGKVLSRDPQIDIKEQALFAYMAALGWVFKRDGRWKAYRTQVSNGRLAEKVGKPYWHEGRGERVNGEPTVRVTPKGLAELHRRLGGTGQLALMAEVSE